MTKSFRILVFILILIAMILPRAAELTKFTAADEPFWLVVGANYYYAITHRELENTVYEYHPAVTTMWIGTAAMLIYFPEYRSIAEGYIHQEKTLFDQFMVEHGKEPLVMLWWVRFIQLLLNIFLFIIIFLLLRYLLDEWTALAVILLASFAPYLFGQSRLLNHESMVGLFSMISVLAMTAHLFRDRKVWLLILSAGAAAFANLTKSSAIVLLPVIGVILFTWALTQWKVQKWGAIGTMFKLYGGWLVALLLVYFIAWPGMWVAPGKMLYEVYGNAFSYAFQGARLSVTHELNPSSFSVNSAWTGMVAFFISIAWRTTPITWIGFFLSILFLFNRDRELVPSVAKYLIAFMLLDGLACITMFSIVQGRDQPHYVLVAYYAVELSAALGWVFALRWLERSFAWAQKPLTQTALFAALLVGQTAGLFTTAPYYYTYFNPIMLSVSAPPVFHYGEKMEEAAAYLASKPDAADSTALVYFGRSFSYYYPGKTLLFAPVLFEDKAQLIERLRESDYLVVYTGLQDRLPILKEMTPEKILYLNGRQYVEIYKVSDVPASFYSE